MSEPLPAWRAVSGFSVLGLLAAVLLSLVPIYLGNYRLTQFIRAVVKEPAAASAPDEILRPRILERARQLNLPVHPEDVRISRDGGKLRLLTGYKVQKDLILAHVDLHFHPEASGPASVQNQEVAR